MFLEECLAYGSDVPRFLVIKPRALDETFKLLGRNSQNVFRTADFLEEVLSSSTRALTSSSVREYTTDEDLEWITELWGYLSLMSILFLHKKQYLPHPFFEVLPLMRLQVFLFSLG